MPRCFFLNLLIFAMASFSSCSQNSRDHSQLKYNPQTSVDCPVASPTDRFVEVPLFWDLAQVGAHVDHIFGLSQNPHASFLKDPLTSKQKLRIYYELAKPYDSSKEILFVQAGGPGGDHSMLHSMLELMPELADKYNVVAMDHRGIGCSRGQFPGDMPFQSMFMRYAAADIEAIRLDIDKNASISFFGVSYGTMLGQTYALLYPDHLQRLILQSAFSEAGHFDIAQAKFEKLAMGTVYGQWERYEAIKVLHPELAKAFVLWAVNPMYTYAGRTKIVPEKFNAFEAAVKADDLETARNLVLPSHWVMPWMTRAIACSEIFKIDTLYKDEFQMFPYNFGTCEEFKGNYEYFNYTEQLKNISTRTMIMGGVFDLVTPIEAMNQMAQRIPNNFYYMDMHLSHAMTEKRECFTSLLNAFLSDAKDDELRAMSLQSMCTLPPKI